jgi:hypothetical protein
MTVIHMGSNTLLALNFQGKWLDLHLAASPGADGWVFQDKAGEMRWSMKEREGILERSGSPVAKCATYLPVDVIMQPSRGS